MSQLNFYKPNKGNTGVAASFNVGTERKEGGTALFMSFVRQFSWDEKTRRGSFSGNAKNPDNTLNIKLNEVEAASIIRAIRTDGEFSTVHDYNGVKTSIKFSPYTKKSGAKAFSMSVVRNGNKFGLGLELGEAELLSLYLQNYLVSFFNRESVVGNSSQ